MPLLGGDVTPVLAHRQDVLHQETAVVFSIGSTAVGTLQDLRHVLQQLAALQPRPACTQSHAAFMDSLEMSSPMKPSQRNVLFL